MIFFGSAGIGKTSTAYALANEVSPDNYFYINASKFNDDEVTVTAVLLIVVVILLFIRQKKKRGDKCRPNSKSIYSKLLFS